MSSIMSVTSEMKSEIINENIDVDQPLSEELQKIKNLKKVFLMIAGSAFQKYGLELEKQQQTLMGLSDMMIEIYFGESAILRTIKNIKRGLDVTHQIDMSKLYVFNATETIIRKSKEITGNIAKGDSQNNLLKSKNRLCRYKNLPDVINLKNRIANKVISENKYCF
jgi:hypothetical protein